MKKLLFVFYLLLVVNVSLVGISSAAIVYVPDNYSSIQEAINAASVDGTVIVYNGTYSENVELNKKLSLLGDGLPTVDAQQKGSAIRITADGCVVKGFRCVKAKYPSNAGIRVESNSNLIENNTCDKNNIGIYLYSHTSDNMILNNEIYHNCGCGVSLSYSTKNTIAENEIYENCGNGVSLYHSSNNTITSNEIYENNNHGVSLMKSSNSTILNNTCRRNSDGICLMFESSNNSIMKNGIHANYKNGIELWDSSKNSLYLNTFVNNSLNANSDRADNIWNSPSKVIYVYNEKEYNRYMGNYWDDYTEKDEDGDGIGDTSYKISEPWNTGVEDDSDDYPLVLPFKDYF